MKKLFFAIALMFSFYAVASPPSNNSKSKFYDFSEQVIDGQIRKPTVTYMNARERARFNRLLQLKKSFMPELFNTSKEKTFK